MAALITLAVLLLGAAVWRPFMRIIGARPSRRAMEGQPRDEILRPFSIYLFGAIFTIAGAYFVFVLGAGAISGIAKYGGYLDYDLMIHLLALPFRF